MRPMILAWGLLAPFWGKIGNQGASVVGSPWAALSSLVAVFSSVWLFLANGLFCSRVYPFYSLELWGGLVFFVRAFGVRN